MLEIETLHTIDTEQSADSVEWCRTPNYQDYFVCGTYELQENEEEESSRVRKGRIYLYKYDMELNELQLKSTINTNAILDQKWIENSLVTATSAGDVECYKLGNQLDFIDKMRLTDVDEEVLALSVDVNGTSRKVLVSDSRGLVTLVDLASMKVETSWMAHEFEAWTCAFDKWNGNVVFTG